MEQPSSLGAVGTQLKTVSFTVHVILSGSTRHTAVQSMQNTTYMRDIAYQNFRDSGESQ